MNFTLLLLAIPSLLFLSALFSGSETALFSLDAVQRKRSSRSKVGRFIKILLAKPHHTLYTILIGNTLVNVIFASLSDLFFERLIGPAGLSLSVVVTTLLLLFVSEITPKLLAINAQERFVSSTARFLTIAKWLLHPAVLFFAALNKLFLKNVSGVSIAGTITRDQVKGVIQLRDGLYDSDEDERRRMQTLFTLRDRPLKGVRTPRSRMVCLPLQVTLERIKETVAKTGFSRFPMYAGELDNVQGYLVVKDLLPHFVGLKPFTGLESYLRPIRFVPEQKRILETLIEMMKLREQILLTLDEFGSISGLVTIENLWEQVVGNIYDEHDSPEEPIQPLGNHLFRLKGSCDPRYSAQKLGFPGEATSFTTISGYITDKLGYIPQKNESITLDGFRLEILRTDQKRILSLNLIAEKHCHEKPGGDEI